ncbi:MAG: His-Xaa-Ser system radical SAM maturase HxsB [Deltaproteobacteria bacterium]|jgi:His-Xaa-Ser system radical SAM maturase HxsB|nr:His-Xaa-Ser system radical SAM maturase HxsB [Deltaproteobacteria bacterium]
MTRLLPFQFAPIRDGRLLLVNECGDYIFVSSNCFEELISGSITEENPQYYDLLSRLFIQADDGDDFAIEKTAAKYRSRKGYLRDFTSLHMLVVTLRCNQRCRYCQVSCAYENDRRYDMTTPIAIKIVDSIFESPSKNIKIEFQGGEPTLNWEAVRQTVLRAEEKKITSDKKISFVLCTNLTGIAKEQLIFCRDHNICISASLDGPKEVHDENRELRSGGSAYDLFVKNLSLAREIIGPEAVDALMTVTKRSLAKLPQIIDQYLALGFNGVFIRALNPYGFAAQRANELGYGAAEFVENYSGALEYIFSINKTRFFPEHFASILLSRILTPFSTGFVDLQSPAGLGLSGVIYDYDGSVYPSDEARMLNRMNDSHFYLGNILHHSYKAIFGGQKLREIIRQTLLEVTPSCSRCVYQAYCGADPVRNYLESKRVVRKMEGTPFCQKHKGIFNYLFSLLENITQERENIIWSWICGSKLTDAHA